MNSRLDACPTIEGIVCKQLLVSADFALCEQSPGNMIQKGFTMLWRGMKFAHPRSHSSIDSAGVPDRSLVTYKLPKAAASIESDMALPAGICRYQAMSLSIHRQFGDIDGLESEIFLGILKQQ